MLRSNGEVIDEEEVRYSFAMGRRFAVCIV